MAYFRLRAHVAVWSACCYGLLLVRAHGQAYIGKHLERDAQAVRPSAGSALAQHLAAQAGFVSSDGLPIDSISIELDRLLKLVSSSDPGLRSERRRTGLSPNVALRLRLAGQKQLRAILKEKRFRYYYPDIGIEAIDRLARAYSGEYRIGKIGLASFESEATLLVMFKRAFAPEAIASRFKKLPEVDSARGCWGTSWPGHGPSRDFDFADMRHEQGRYLLHLWTVRFVDGSPLQDSTWFRVDFDHRAGKFGMPERITGDRLKTFQVEDHPKSCPFRL